MTDLVAVALRVTADLIALGACVDRAVAENWTITGALLAPSGIVAEGSISVSGQKITAVGPTTTSRE
jgi:hypothetical protein